MTTCITAEKPSVARDIARIIGAIRKQDSYMEGNGYLVTWVFDLLITLTIPEERGSRSTDQTIRRYSPIHTSWYCDKPTKVKSPTTTLQPSSSSKLFAIALPRQTKSSLPQMQGENFAIYNKVAKCKDEACGFKVFRELCGTFLSDNNIQDLITKGKTPTLKGMTSKAGKKFNARLVLREDFSTSFEFEARAKKK